MLSPDDPGKSLADSELSVRVERDRCGLRVIASAPAGRPELVVRVTFAGGSDGIAFSLLHDGKIRHFSDQVVRGDRPLGAVLRLIADEVELSKPCSEALLTLLFRSLLVYVARMAKCVPRPRWGRPIRDARIERALELLEADLSKYWTVELLARAVGLSRPVFARQFVRMLQLSPMRYLANRRMQLASELLVSSDAGLAEVAARVGYQSEFAFGRAFKRHHRVAPGTYRRQLPVAGRTALRMAA